MPDFNGGRGIHAGFFPGGRAALKVREKLLLHRCHLERVRGTLSAGEGD
jgi:hypothetical protein